MNSGWDTNEPSQNQTRGFGRGVHSSRDIDQTTSHRTMNKTYSPRGRGRGMMREEDTNRASGYSETFGQSETGQDTVTLYIENSVIGRVIGKGGSNVRELEEQSGAKLKVSRDRSGGTVPVEVIGTPEQVAHASELIEQCTGSQRQESRNGFGGGQWSEADTSVTLQVESRDVGRIIGRGGRKISQLQEDSGAHINVSRDKSGATVDVDLSGSAEQVALARQMIEELIDSAGDRGFGGGGGGFGRSGGRGGEEQGDSRDPGNRNGFGGGQWSSDSASITLQVESRNVGRIIGRGGSKIRELQEVTGAHVNVSRDKSGDMVDVELSGSADQVARVRQLIEELTDGSGDRGYGGGGGGFGRGGGEERGESRNEFGGGQWSSEGASVTLQVESRDVGRIIGRGGSKIRQLQEDSGARINVSRDKSGATVDVDLSGSADQVAMARQLIEELIDSAGDRGFGGGGGGGGFGRGGGGEETVMEVDSSDVGKIIGRGGSRIRELQVDSGAHIEVSRDSSGPTVTVTLKGSEEVRSLAKQMIEDIIEPSE